MFDGHLRRILITDDDPVLRALGAEQLRSDGFDVIEAGDGVEALEAMRESRFDMLICDIDMPRMTGFDVLKAVRAARNRMVSGIPVLMLTGRDDEESIARSYKQGATSFMQKPVNWHLMSRHIGFVLRADLAARELREARDALLAASSAKDSLMATLRHELRSPLHVISGFVDVVETDLGTGAPPETMRENLGYIRSAAETMTQRVNSLFEYAEILADNFDIRAEWTDVNTPLTAAIDRVKAFAAESEVHIEVVSAERGLEVHCDAQRIASALAALIHNAIKFSAKQGKIIVKAQFDNGVPVYRVRDHGTGMEQEKLASYVKAFEQGDSGLTRVSTGLGLGLTIAYEIVSMHGGTLKFASRPDKGVLAEVRLPRARTKNCAA